MHHPRRGSISDGSRTSRARQRTKVGPLRSGAPAIVQTQVRTEVEATVSLEFESWGKLQLAVAAGSEQMNLLATANSAAANGSGGIAATAIPLVAGSTSTTLDVGSASASFSVGELVAVDLDYSGQIGYVGSGVSAAYVISSSAVGGRHQLHPPRHAQRRTHRRNRFGHPHARRTLARGRAGRRDAGRSTHRLLRP